MWRESPKRREGKGREGNIERDVCSVREVAFEPVCPGQRENDANRWNKLQFHNFV
jgi:hypothetical protein